MCTVVIREGVAILTQPLQPNLAASTVSALTNLAVTKGIKCVRTFWLAIIPICAAVLFLFSQCIFSFIMVILDNEIASTKYSTEAQSDSKYQNYLDIMPCLVRF